MILMKIKSRLNMCMKIRENTQTEMLKMKKSFNQLQNGFELSLNHGRRDIQPTTGRWSLLIAL